MAEAAPKHDVFQAIADPTRRKLLGLLSEQEMPVTALSSHFPMSRTAVSKHLRILSEAGLVAEQKVGRETRYRLQPEPLQELRDWLGYFERYWNNKLAALKLLVESDDPASLPKGPRPLDERRE
ncbi:ArsR/SmtB family transcription factor [Cohnella nanjingensis]|uniref:Winged helix-turn-helix transcriptional regulator n=1 Tax=Cohnella nanjingensis TaxID=1387779 RepID=A0A7X0VF75_9BACL|nr:metalloregulator ArsR/SmtB family transcription factor [Cohnella nanjingensis]MBB6671752.1 winged helix-turn-helix transcriptional regulator [Cohnella nanjingensis]